MIYNSVYPVKEENAGSSSSAPGGGGPCMKSHVPQPMEGLYEVGPPPFLTKTFDMVDDPITNHIVSWSREGSSFVVLDPHSFSTNLLPSYFKHSNYSSFIRQLNTYGFRKVDPDIWEFANEGFLRGQKYLLRNIKRRKAPSSQTLTPQEALGPCVEVGRFGQNTEIDRVKRDNQVLITELVNLRQQQQNTRSYIKTIEQRLRTTEMKQRQMMNFLARAIQNPDFIQQLVQQKEKRKQLEEAFTKKRRWPIDQGPRNEGSSNPVKMEPFDIGDCGLEVSELEALALEMQGLGNARKEEILDLENSEKEQLDEGFWEELFSEDEDDVYVLADQ